MADHARTVLIVGGGIAGTAAALHVAEAGHRALLVDEAPVIGGALLLLDKTYPTDSCGICFLAPNPPAVCPFLECERDPRVEIRTSTRLLGLSGEPGDFRVKLSSGPRFVDADLCDGCGLCVEACPQEVGASHLGAAWLGEKRKVIYRPVVQSVPASFVIDAAHCDHCGECVKVCPQKAIDLQRKELTETVEAAAVVLAPGFGPNDAHVRGAYGYGQYPNVVSSLEYERMLSTSSPSRGQPVRPSDGRPASRVAIIHCVGSRDRSCGVPYCSAACCMIAAKQASLTKRRNPEAEVSVFTMDVRAAGRGYERYLAGVKGLPGVTYHRSLVSSVKLDPRTQDLTLQYSADGRSNTQTFDLVVLDVGMVVPSSVRNMAGVCGIELDEYGFGSTLEGRPTQTSRPGVFVAGSFREPKDVPATIPESIAAAAQALELAGALAGELPELDEGRVATPSFYDRPAIGVFLDTEKSDWASLLDVAALASSVGELPDVAYVSVGADEAKLCAAAAEHKLTYLIVGTRSARRDSEDQPTAGGVPLTRVALGAADAFVHRERPDDVNRKAFDMLRMAVLAARLSSARPVEVRMPEPRALVLGGSLAGLAAARTLSSQGVETHLVETGKRLGDGEVLPWVGDWMAQLERDPRVTVHTSTQLKSFGGGPGNMRTVLSTPSGDIEIAHGALVLAMGAKLHRPDGYGLGQRAPVILQHELGERIATWKTAVEGEALPSQVVMWLCAETRQGARPYCSRTCCSEALQNAITLMELAPKTRIVVLYRDLVTLGFQEDLYQQARDGGVLFLRYTLERPPQLEGDKVMLVDDVLGEEVRLQPDLLVLSAGIVPGDDYAKLACALGIALDDDGFFAPVNIKSQPMDINRPGMYLAGQAGGPATVEETIEQGMAAGLRAALFLRRGLKTPTTLATVNERLCSGCALCVQVCPTKARHVDEDEGVAKVDPWLCLGCGVCVAVCPNKASGQALYETRGVLSAIDAALG